MKKYFRPFSLSIQSVFQYRMNIVLYMLFGLLPLVAIIGLWHAVFTDQKEIAGYTLEAMLTYVIIAKILELVLLPEMQWSIQGEIESGELSKYLIKPMSYIGYWFTKNLGNKIVHLLMAMVPLSAIILLNWEYFLFPKLQNIFPLLISILNAMILYFLIYYLVALLSLYFVQIASFFFTLDIVLELLAGTLIPLELLPYPINEIVQMLPFAFLINFPVKIYLGNLNATEIWSGIGVQVFWCFVFYFLSRIVWKKGLTKYESVGA